jgi:hypothetical protein
MPNPKRPESSSASGGLNILYIWQGNEVQWQKTTYHHTFVTEFIVMYSHKIMTNGQNYTVCK